MFICFKNHFYKLLCLFFIILIGCQLQEPSKNHGIIFLKNRSDKLIINKSNKNDILKVIGQPHSKSIDDDEIWLYFERILVRGQYHKLGQNILKTNNVLVLKFNKYGILEQKKFFNKENKKDLKFTENITENDLSRKSFVQTFLQSIKQKMYGNK
tara:strand:- start:355 stop:819 length:465 start_codon:yes stop_codon:yes gene_type:complete